MASRPSGGRVNGRPRRRSIRLRGFDYSSPGAYFITVCTARRTPLFANARLARVAQGQWLASVEHRPEIALDRFVVMPDHIHGIVWITAEFPPRGRGSKQTARVAPGSLPAFVRAYKSAVTREVNLLRGTPGGPVWQRNYYEHVVRNEADLDRIRKYIVENPARWTWGHARPRRRPARVRGGSSPPLA